GRFHAMAVAGTTRRSRDPEEDERLGRALLESAKDRAEHAIGVRDMRERLAALGAEPTVDESPHLLRLRGIQHLGTDLSIRAAGGRTVLDLLEAMHPTAAVSGYPREPAAAFLRERERFERGWYAGPVGWFDASGDGAFAPALRCAVVRGDRARLFAGAGIVEGSDPVREWEETAMKLRPALEVLGAASAPGDGGEA
ncbi:MAG TPA: chorismate-binding protein, partial [Gemmatimonadota bacterium]|nr:chorismate-binding protein [Gemmatimonadota bacterium]